MTGVGGGRKVGLGVDTMAGAAVTGMTSVGGESDVMSRQRRG